VRLAESERDLDIAGIAMDDEGTAEVWQFVGAAGVPYPILLPTAPSPMVDAIQSLPTTGGSHSATSAPSTREQFVRMSTACRRNAERQICLTIGC
jgi:hypothetical protein